MSYAQIWPPAVLLFKLSTFIENKWKLLQTFVLFRFCCSYRMTLYTPVVLLIFFLLSLGVFRRTHWRSRPFIFLSYFFFCGYGGVLLVIPIFVLRCFSSGIEGHAARWCYIDPLRCPDFRASNAEEKVGPLFSHWDTAQHTSSAKSKNTPTSRLASSLSMSSSSTHTVYIAFLSSLFSFFLLDILIYVRIVPTHFPLFVFAVKAANVSPLASRTSIVRPRRDVVIQMVRERSSQTIYHHHHLPCYML